MTWKELLEPGRMIDHRDKVIGAINNNYEKDSVIETDFTEATKAEVDSGTLKINGISQPALEAIASDVPAWAKKTNLDAADVPNLDAAKITSGEFNVVRIPTLTLAKISDSGVLAAKDEVAKADLATALSSELDGKFDSSDVANALATADWTDLGIAKTDVSKADVGLSNVDNKSSATIRSEITSANLSNKVDSGALQSGAVIEAKIASNAVSANKIANGAVKAAKLDIDDDVDFGFNAAKGLVIEEGELDTSPGYKTGLLRVSNGRVYIFEASA